MVSTSLCGSDNLSSILSSINFVVGNPGPADQLQRDMERRVLDQVVMSLPIFGARGWYHYRAADWRVSIDQGCLLVHHYKVGFVGFYNPATPEHGWLSCHTRHG